MNKELKNLIEKAEDYELGKPLSSFYIVSTNKLYNGFWGKNGYNGIIIIGVGYKEDKLYFVNRDYECDVIHLMQFRHFTNVGGMSIDIPNDKNCIHMWFDKPICFKYLLSSMQIEAYETIKWLEYCTKGELK